MKPVHQHKLKRKSLLRTELIGAAFMIALGSILHFAFDWFGSWMPLALVAAVNESIWEHLKLVFWPGVLWGTVIPSENNLRRQDILAVKGISLLTSAALIVTIFISYTAILGDNRLVYDIGTFVVAVLAGQLLSALLLAPENRWRRRLFLPGLVLFALQLSAFSLFTYFPPDHWLFVEEHSGLRGLPGR